ncbi:hypothetical protein [Desulfosporosinus sp.]|uniref:hypothetical protein n=1 Tax=Desulfosporosinus sp. TaxID=157907 RepID=UPI0025C21714|nr:hypothetical protein [Desulfosporosinus sp.]MBC2727159.1 hypothetical protein [Desulfosporosinus sp.]
MPYLGDYLGYLITEITNARAQADYEAVNIAERYARDPYLKYLPVPRFKIPTLSIDVPLVINNIQEPTGRSSNDQILSYMQAKFRKLLPRQLNIISTLYPRTTKMNNINIQTDKIFEEFKQLDYTPIRITHIADKLVASVIRELKESTPLEDDKNNNKLDEFAHELRQQLYSEFSKYLRDQPRLDITANTSDIKNAGSKDILAYVRFTVTEDSLEWTTVDEGDVAVRRLIPE